MSEFRKGNAPILVATDVASRGLGLYMFFLLVNQHSENFGFLFFLPMLISYLISFITVIKHK